MTYCLFDFLLVELALDLSEFNLAGNQACGYLLEDSKKKDLMILSSIILMY